MTFKNYKLIENVISEDLRLNLVTQFQMMADLIHFQNNTKIEDFKYGDNQVQKSFMWYGSIWSESLLLNLRPLIEQHTNKNLIPTYSYARIYYPGAILERHTDRESCEYSATLTLGVEGKDWPIYFENSDKEIVKFIIPERSMVIYKGIDLPHWRNQLDHLTTKQYQVFLHYVDADGPHKSFIKDKRPLYGMPSV